MQKILVPMSVVVLLGSGLCFYSHMMSDEMVLSRLGYDRNMIETLISEQPDLVHSLINDQRNSEEIEDYLMIKGRQGVYLDNAKMSGKEWPSNPSNTGTFTLKCVDGVLTWVQDQ